MSTEQSYVALQTAEPGRHLVIVAPGHTWCATDEQMQSLLAWMHYTPGSFTEQRWSVNMSRLTLYFFDIEPLRVDGLLASFGATLHIL